MNDLSYLSTLCLEEVDFISRYGSFFEKATKSVLRFAIHAVVYCTLTVLLEMNI